MTHVRAIRLCRTSDARSCRASPNEAVVRSKRCTDTSGCSALHSDSGGCIAVSAVLREDRAKSVTFSLMECIRGVRFAPVTRVWLWKSGVAHLAVGFGFMDRRPTLANLGSRSPPPGMAILVRSSPEIQQKAWGVVPCDKLRQFAPQNCANWHRFPESR